MTDGPVSVVLALSRSLCSALGEEGFDEYVGALAATTGAEGAWLARRQDAAFVPVAAILRGTPCPSQGGVRRAEVLATDLPTLGRRTRAAASLTTSEVAALGVDTRSALGVPLVAHDAVVGALVLLGTEAVTEHASWLLAELASQTAMTLQTHAALEVAARTLRQQQAILDAMDLMVIVADTHGAVRRVNRALQQRLGASARLIGRPAEGLFPGQHLPVAGEHPRTTLTGPSGEPLRATAHALPDGSAVIVVQDTRPGSMPRMTALRRQPTPSVQPQQHRVLVVDDEPSILRAVSRMLSPQHHVTTAGDGSDAIALLETGEHVDVVVTDLQMPRVGGLDLYRWIEQQRPLLAARVLFVTGGVFDPETERFLRGMVGRVLRKPFDPEALRRAVDERASV